MQPVSVCQKVSWNCFPEYLLRPDDRFGVQRFADTAQVPQARQIVFPDELVAFLHEQADRRGRRIPDRNPMLFNEFIPVLGAETGVQDGLRDAVRPGTNDAIGRAGDPARIGIAPVDIVGLQVQHPFGGEILRDERIMDMLRALRLAGGAGRVVQNRWGFGRGRIDFERSPTCGAFSIGREISRS